PTTVICCDPNVAAPKKKLTRRLPNPIAVKVDLGIDRDPRICPRLHEQALSRRGARGFPGAREVLISPCGKEWVGNLVENCGSPPGEGGAASPCPAPLPRARAKTGARRRCGRLGDCPISSISWRGSALMLEQERPRRGAHGGERGV